MEFHLCHARLERPELFLPQILRGFPQVFVVAPAVTLGLGSLSPARLKYASGLFNMMRNLGGAIGIAGCATILNNRANLHFLRLAEHLNAGNSAMVQTFNRFSAHFTQINGGDAVHGHNAALKELWLLTFREAQVQTFADAFLMMAACFVVATVLVPLMRKVVTATRASRRCSLSPSLRQAEPFLLRN